LRRRLKVKRLSWYVAVPGMVGIALVIAAVLLLMTMAAGKTPTANAQIGCVLTVEKTANVAYVGEGGSIEWTLTVTNTGPGTCYDLEVTDALDALTTCEGVDTATGSADCTTATSVDWDFDDLGSGEDATLTIDVDLTAAAEDGDVIENDAAAEACFDDGECDETPDVTEESNTVDVTVSDCDLRITKVADFDTDDDAVFKGDDITYEIVVTNRDEGCVNPVITDDLENDLDCNDVDVDDGDLTCHVTGCSSDDITISCTGVLEEDDEIAVSVQTDVDRECDEDDDVVNRACVQGAEGVERCATEEVDCQKHVVPCPTVLPPVPVVTPVVIIQTPVATPLPTLAAPKTGTGSDSGSTPWLPIGLGIGGVCMLLASGTVLAKKRI
jgi:uncharacterized repeat protein (TIGR01451 family)